MEEKRCTNCNRLLFIQSGLIKTVKTNDNIVYHIDGDLTIKCKCGTINKF